MKLGLTGGIACGKTTVASALGRWGAAVIDSDELAHAAIAPGGPAYDEVIAHFGPEMLDADGTINRERLGEIVFQDERQRERLNQIVHPRVREQWQRRSAEIEARSPRAVIAIVIPLLYETGAELAFEAVLAIGCRPATQMRRLGDRGLTGAQIDARIRSQWPLPRKMERADFVVWNEYSLAILERQTQMVWYKLATLKDRRN